MEADDRWYGLLVRVAGAGCLILVCSTFEVRDLRARYSAQMGKYVALLVWLSFCRPDLFLTFHRPIFETLFLLIQQSAACNKILDSGGGI